MNAFAHDGIVVSVDAPEADRAWLEEFLTPAFAVAESGPEDIRVSFGPTHSTVERRFSDGHVAFALDSGPIRLPESPIAGGLRLHDDKAGLTVDVTGGGRDVRVLYHASRLKARMRLMRIVREYAHNHSVRTGGLMLHAAAVVVDGATVAVAGPRGVGKTTLALRLLAVPGVDYLSNDRVLVRLESQLRAFAVPTVIALRADSRRLMPGLTERLSQCGDFREHAEERRARGASPPVMVDDTWNVGPRQLCAALERPLHVAAPLAALLFPIADRAASSLRRLPHGEATEALKGAVLCRGTGHYVSDVFVAAPGSIPDEARLDSYCDTLASRVACFACARADDASRIVAQLRDDWVSAAGRMWPA